MTEGDKPNLVIIAGPNGAGKSTTAPAILQETLDIQEFVNADAIAKGLSAFQPQSTAIEAGRIMLRRIHELARSRASFAFETTLASRSFAPWIKDLRDSGYLFVLVFLWLPAAETAILRVKERTRNGGHDVPEGTIRRRYRLGLQNFFGIYQPMADYWFFQDNSKLGGPELIASGHNTITEEIKRPDLWNRIQELGK